MVFIYKGNSSATAESKLLVIGGSGGLTSSLARQVLCPVLVKEQTLASLESRCYTALKSTHAPARSHVTLRHV